MRPAGAISGNKNWFGTGAHTYDQRKDTLAADMNFTEKQRVQFRRQSFALEGLSMGNADSIRAQITDGGRELTIENIGAAKTFNLRLLAGLQHQTVGVRSNVTLDAASVVRLRPSNWSVGATAAPIRLEVLDTSWQKVLRATNV